MYEEGDEIYDPVYLISAFYHSLGPGKVLQSFNCKLTIE